RYRNAGYFYVLQQTLETRIPLAQIFLAVGAVRTPRLQLQTDSRGCRHELCQVTIRPDAAMPAHNPVYSEIGFAQGGVERVGVRHWVAWGDGIAGAVEVTDEDDFLLGNVGNEHACRVRIWKVAQLDGTLAIRDGFHITDAFNRSLQAGFRQRIRPDRL